jgi:hypothetical protein
MRKSILIVLVLFIAIAYFISQKQAYNQQSNVASKTWVGKIKSLISIKNEQEAVLVSEDKTDLVLDSVDIDNLADLSEQNLDIWIQSEAKKMDLTNNDSDSQMVQLRAKALTATKDQIQILVTKALDANLPINQRIFSAYFVTLTQDVSSHESMENIAAHGLTDFGAPVPHSEAELKRSQELALKYMQIDELFQRAKTDAQAKERLKRLASSAGSDEVRNYAEKKLIELK